MQTINAAPGRASVFALWLLIFGAVAFMAGLFYIAKDLRDGDVAQPKPNYAYHEPDPSLLARSSKHQGENAADQRKLGDYERLKADAEHRLAYLSWREANAGVQVADAGVVVSRYAAKIGVIGAIIAGMGALLSAIAAGVAVLAFSESRRATILALTSHLDGRETQRAFLSCRLDAGAYGDRLVVKNVGMSPALLTSLRQGSIATTSGLEDDVANLRVGRGLADILGPGEEGSFDASGPPPGAGDDRVMNVTFADAYGAVHHVQARFGDGPFSRFRKAQGEV